MYYDIAYNYILDLLSMYNEYIHTLYTYYSRTMVGLHTKLQNMSYFNIKHDNINKKNTIWNTTSMLYTY